MKEFHAPLTFSTSTEDTLKGVVSNLSSSADSCFAEEVYAKELYRGPQPTNEQLVEMANAGIKTIIDLRNPGESVTEEKARATKLGMNFISVPMGLACPTKEAMDKIIGIIANPINQPVYIHCLRGKDRTGAAVACYKMKVHGVSYQEANQDRKNHNPGFWSLSLDDSLKYYR